MLHEYFVHFLGSDLLAAAVDDLLQPAGEEQIAFLVESPLIARSKPTVGECALVGCGIALVSRRDVRSANDDLTNFASRQQIPGRRP